MKKICQKTISLLLTLCLLSSFFPVGAYAADRRIATDQEPANLKSSKISFWKGADLGYIPSSETTSHQNFTSMAEGSIIETEAIVSNWDELNTAVCDTNISTIKIACDIDLEDALEIGRSLRIVSNNESDTYKLYAAPQKRHMLIAAETEAIHIQFSGIELDCWKHDSGGLMGLSVCEAITIDNLVLRGFKEFPEGESYHEYGIAMNNLTINDSKIIDCRSDALFGSGEINNCLIEIDPNTDTRFTQYRAITANQTKINCCKISGFNSGIRGTVIDSTYIANTEILNCIRGVDLCRSQNSSQITPYNADIINCNIHDCDYGIALDSSYDIGLSAWSNAYVTNSDIHNCRVAIDLTGANVYLTDSDLYDNYQGIDAYHSKVCVNGGKIFNNESGGIGTWHFCHVSLVGCELCGNGTQDGYGSGAIHASYGDSFITVQWNPTRVTIEDCSIHDNKAFSGGGIAVDRAYLTVENSEIYNNEAKRHGGGIRVLKGPDTKITNTRIYGNSAGEYGGGAYFEGESQTTVTNCTLSSNEAMKGGGMYLPCKDDSVESLLTTISNTIISNNHAQHYGGAIYCENYARLYSDEVTQFTNNTVPTICVAEDAFANSYPNLKFASTSHGSHLINNADINYTTETEEIKMLCEVPWLYKQNVLYGTAPNSLSLPDEMVVYLDDNVELEVPVEWNIDDFNNTLYAEDQTITGDFVLPEGVTNPKGCVAEVCIRVQPPHIVSCTPPDPIQVPYGTDVEDVMGILQSQYPVLPVTLASGEVIEAPIFWTTDDNMNDEYDGLASGTYSVYGRIDTYLGDSYCNANQVNAVVNVTVDARPPEVISFSQISDYSFALNTTAEMVQTVLNSEHSTVDVTLSNGESRAYPVMWDMTKPANADYSGTVPGEYTIEGTVDFGSDLYWNPEDKQPTTKVEIRPSVEKRIIAVKPCYLETRKYFYLDTKAETEGFEILDLEETPKEVTVVLENRLERKVPVEWDDTNFDPSITSIDSEQVLQGRLVLDENMGIVNETGLPAELHITVTPMDDYWVMETHPEEIDIEVYAGTTLEELNLQLKNEGKSHLTIGLEDGEWGSYTCCEFEVKESENPEWETLKNVAGNEEPYQLTASLPEEMLLLCDPPIVNVTVLEPLRVDAVVSPTIEAYQSAELENVPGLPDQVQAVLEDGRSVFVDVEWTPTAYNKDLVGPHVVLGYLTNLPRMIKVPDSGKIIASMAVNVIPVNYEIIGIVQKEAYTADAGLTLEEITEIVKPQAIYEISSTTEGIVFTTQYATDISFEQRKNTEFNLECAGSYMIKGALQMPDNISCPQGHGYEEISLTTNPVRVLSIETPSILTKEGTEFTNLEKPQTVIATLSCLDPKGNNKKVSLAVDWGIGTGYIPFPETLTDNNTVTMSVTGQIVNCPQYINLSGAEPSLQITTAREFTVTEIAPIPFSGDGNMKVNLGSSLSDIYNQLDSHSTEITLESTNGSTSAVEITFTLRSEDNPEYDPFTVGMYTLTAHVDLSDNVKNPNNLKSELPVETVKYTVTNAQIVRLNEIPVGTQFEDLPLPNVAAVLKNDGSQEDISVTWSKGKYDPNSLKAQVIQGTFDEMPIYLENPKNRQPRAIVTLVNEDAEILSLTEMTEQLSGLSVYSNFDETELQGYEEHSFLATMRYPDGKVLKTIISAYTEES